METLGSVLGPFILGSVQGASSVDGTVFFVAASFGFLWILSLGASPFMIREA